MSWQRKVKSTEGYLTESRYTSDRLRAGFGKKPSETLKQREAKYAQDRESVNLNWLMDEGGGGGQGNEEEDWLGSLHKSLDDANLEGENNAKYDEMERELFNAVEALESQKAESSRVKNELVRVMVERDELVEALSSKPNEKPPVSVEVLRKLKEDVGEMVREAEKREKVEEDLRVLVKHSEERCEDMERKWLEEQRVVEEELKRMGRWKFEAEKGLEELEREKDLYKKKWEEGGGVIENLKGEILGLKEGEPLVVKEEVLVVEEEDVVLEEDEEEKEREAFRQAVAAWRVDTEDISKASSGDKILTARSTKKEEEGDEEEEEGASEEVLDVLADIETDEQYTAPPETLSPAPPTPNPKPLSLKMPKSATSSPASRGNVSDDDSEKSIEWEASSLTPGKSKSPLMSSASTAALQMINARPKASIELSKPKMATVPKAKPTASPKRKGKGGKRVRKSPAKSPKKKAEAVDVDVDVGVGVGVGATVGAMVGAPRATPDSPLSPTIPPRRKKKANADTEAVPVVPVMPSPPFPSNLPPAPPPISYKVPPPSIVPSVGPYAAQTTETPDLINPPEIMRQDLVVTQELQMKYAREKTPDRKKKKKKGVGTKKKAK